MFLLGTLRKPTGKIHFYCLCMHNRSFVGLHMRICYQNNGGLSTKMANFGGIFSAIVRLFRLGGGATDSDNVSFYLLIHVKILFHEGCNRIYFLSIFSMLIPQPKRKLCSATLTKRLDSNDLYIIYLEKKS